MRAERDCEQKRDKRGCIAKVRYKKTEKNDETTKGSIPGNEKTPLTVQLEGGGGQERPWHKGKETTRDWGGREQGAPRCSRQQATNNRMQHGY